MNKSGLLWLCFSLLFSAYLWTLPSTSHAQSQSTTDSSSKTTSGNGNGTSVSVAATVSIQVANETLKAKEGLLRGSVINFLNSGHNVLKTAPTDQPVVKTKIANQINKATQNVEGMEATNAIIGVEISKALKSLVSTGSVSNQAKIITISTSSTCNPISNNSISCENAVTIR